MTPEEMLVKAVKDRHYNGVGRAFNAKADVNAVDGTGWTSLHYAAYHGFDEIVDLLLSRPDIDVNAATPQHETARDLAFIACRDDIAQKLDALPPRVDHASRVAEPKAGHLEASISTKGRQRPLFD